MRRPKGLSFVVVASLLMLLLLPVLSAHAEDSKKESKHSASESSSAKKKSKKKKGSGIEEADAEKVVGADPSMSEKQFAQEAANASRVDAVIVLDSSRSMQRTDPKRLRDQGAKLFIRFLSQGDRVAVVQFDREAKAILPMTEVTPQSIAKIDQAIESVPVEGGFTDVDAGIESAIEILGHDGRLDATKTIVLLSDGKMDPHPSRGTPEQVAKALKETTLPQLSEKHLKLYTVAFSDESDKAELASYAEIGGGQSWFAPDANTIHRKFSELFLTLKQPQVVPLEGDGFEIDSVQEATFYVTRKEGNESVVLVDPKGQRMSSESIPVGVKWFRGEQFDVITISKPLPGRWTIQGMEKVEGFATLLTDIKLQVPEMAASYKLGDTVAIYARLANDKETIQQPGLEDITFFTYKVVNAESGELAGSGTLNDKGERGDTKAGDGIYSGTMKVEKGGDFQVLVAVTSPTFTRQQRRSFSVSTGLVTLRAVAADQFLGGQEHLEVALTRPVAEYKSLKVKLAFRHPGDEKWLAVALVPKKENPQLFDVPLEKIKSGEYEFEARMTAVDAKKRDVNGSSETVKFTIPAREGETGGSEAETEDLAEDTGAPHEGVSIVEIAVGTVLLLVSGALVAGTLVLGKRKVGSSKSEVVERKPYVMPDDLKQRIQEVRERSSEAKRRANSDEREIFRSVADVYGKDEEAPAQGGGEAPDAAEEDAA